MGLDMFPRLPIAGLLDGYFSDAELAHMVFRSATGTNLPHCSFGQFRSLDLLPTRSRPMNGGIVRIALRRIPAKVAEFVVSTVAIAMASEILSRRRLADKGKKDGTMNVHLLSASERANGVPYPISVAFIRQNQPNQLAFHKTHVPLASSEPIL
ncbi:hypothetical protein PQR31_00985 [Paraburkholderia dipogonis]